LKEKNKKRKTANKESDFWRISNPLAAAALLAPALLLI
jgi:hypothetical protein